SGMLLRVPGRRGTDGTETARKTPAPPPKSRRTDGIKLGACRRARWGSARAGRAVRRKPSAWPCGRLFAAYSALAQAQAPAYSRATCYWITGGNENGFRLFAAPARVDEEGGRLHGRPYLSRREGLRGADGGGACQGQSLDRGACRRGA